MVTDVGDPRTVWFYRDHSVFSGGQLKHSHYFDHVRHLPGFAPRITFSDEPSSPSLERQRRCLWPVDSTPHWEPDGRAILFVAGLDWRYLLERGLDTLPNPRINLVQHGLHANEGTERYAYLALKAIRICVSQEVADAISATRRVNGPVLTIPNGTDLEPVTLSRSSLAGRPARRHLVTIVGYKRPDLARALSGRLREDGVPHTTLTELLERSAFLGFLAESEIAVCLPNVEEGFYLPALEGMASGCLVVTLDCRGNRGFCHDKVNCLIAEDDTDSLVRATKQAIRMATTDREAMLLRAKNTVVERALHTERRQFHTVLQNLDDLWCKTCSKTASEQVSSENCERVNKDVKPYRPLVDFMIVGAQKCGTTFLARLLSQHPEIGLSDRKEVHLFDAPEYSPDWSPARIDARYARHFAHCPSVKIRGEATPIYMYLRDIAPELKRYNPDLKLIVLLRDPVERALSHYYMEKGRGNECRPLWLALLSEPIRLWRCHEDRQWGSAVRHYSYRHRGLYSLQLRNLSRSFDSDSILIIQSRDILRRPDTVARQVFAFLGVAPETVPPLANVFVGDYDKGASRVASRLLRLSYLAEFVRLRAFFAKRDGRIANRRHSSGRDRPH